MSDEPTSPPTARRLRRALAHGNVPVSPLAVTTAASVAVVAALPAAVGATMLLFEATLDRAVAAPSTVASYESLGDLLVGTALVAAPALLSAPLAAVAIALVQSGGTLRPERREPRARARATDTRSYAAARAVAIALAATLAGAVALDGELAVAAGSATTASGALELAGRALLRVAWTMTAALALVAGLDAVVTRLAWRRQLWMTRSEVEEERRHSEPNPELARARQRAHREP